MLINQGVHMSMDRNLSLETIEGEVSLVIDYSQGHTVAVDLLQGAMNLIASLDELDKVLLSSVNTTLEPVSIINDIQKSSLKLLLARALKNIPDDEIKNLEWKKAIGRLLTHGKHKLLSTLESGNRDTPAVQKILEDLGSNYKAISTDMVGYDSPSVVDVVGALDKVEKARATLSKEKVLIQTELGDINLPDASEMDIDDIDIVEVDVKTNKGEEFLKIKQVDMLGNSQWTVIRNSRAVKVDILHQSWLIQYHNREIKILPGDSLLCKYEERIAYDKNQNEIERRLSIVEVLDVIRPPKQENLNY